MSVALKSLASLFFARSRNPVNFFVVQDKGPVRERTLVIKACPHKNQVCTL